MFYPGICDNTREFKAFAAKHAVRTVGDYMEIEEVEIFRAIERKL